MTYNFSFKDFFGHCIIPKNTLLYRGHNDNSFIDCMFFGLKHSVGALFGKNIQVWKTTTAITVLFLVEHINERSWSTSALPRLYNGLFPDKSNSDFKGLDIKHWDINRRTELVRKLFNDYEISGWLTSLEDKIELEICLFDKHANSNQLVLIDNSNQMNKNYFKDSLHKVTIFPSKNFYDKTDEIIKQRLGIQIKGNNYFKNYRKTQNIWVKNDAKNEQEKKELQHFYFNLRMKLKI